jgi:hypothetical protein
MSGCAMVTHTTITLDLLDDYLSCKYKAYLRLAGHQGIKSEYEAGLFSALYMARSESIASTPPTAMR